MQWYYSVWFVLLMLFAIAGPFGLPFLWKSPRFHRVSKVVLTALMGCYTYGLIRMITVAVQAALTHIHDIQLTFP